VRLCLSCQHEKRREIDEALLANAPLRDVARRFGLSKDSVARHKRDHLPKALIRAREAEAIAHGDDLLSQMNGLNARTLKVLAQAEAAGDGRTFLAAVREARGNVELMCRMIVAIKAQAPSHGESGEEERKIIRSIELALFGPSRCPDQRRGP
jgi:hypothetical protein